MKTVNKKINHSADISPTFCILPWIHLSTRPNGHMRLCCTSNASSVGALNDKKWGGEVGILKQAEGLPANFNHTDLKTAWNSDYMKRIRKNMLSGKIPPSCSKCFKEEKQGYQSKRIWENRHWFKKLSVTKLLQDTKRDGTIPNKIYYMDLRFGTKCNLKCIMCSPHDSSLWVSDWNKLYPQIQNKSLKELMVWSNKGKVHGASYNWYKNNQGFWNQLLEQIPNMKQLYFAGGESTIIPEHYKLLETCVEKGYAKQIDLRYNSNGIELPEKLFKLWEKFRSVIFHFSLDSIYEQNNYIRFPSDFSVLEKQLRRLDETSDSVSVTIACAIQVLNIYYIPEFIKWKLACRFKKINAWPKSAGLIDTHFVYHPAHLNVKILPLEFKKEVVKKFEDFYLWLEKEFKSQSDFLKHPYGISRLKGMCQFMLSEDWSNRMPEFREYILKMDKIRGLNFKETFPEMAKLLDNF
ncbi:MAG: twitch domain-containing radical SAM protein [Bdellovibrionales bacterium]|nr:twitch domain-containing radical SAM protein [Bdellovibrionales bacterium]